MGYKIILNPDIEKRREIQTAIMNNEGYCCCSIIKTPENLCPCVNFTNTLECECGLYIKVSEED